jgi:hypothetical protein
MSLLNTKKEDKWKVTKLRTNWTDNCKSKACETNEVKSLEIPN